MRKSRFYLLICLLLLGNYSLSQLQANTRGLNTFECIVSSGNDDVSEDSAGAMVLDGEFLWLGGSTSGKLRAIRFENVMIPDNAIIHDAYIEFYSYGDSEAASANITVEIGNPATYSSTKKSISSRSYSTRKTTWSRSGGLTAKRTVRTPNLNNVIDENRGRGWRSGQSLAFRFEGLNTNKGLSVYAYEGGSAYRPKLVVKYHTDSEFVYTDLSESIVSASKNDASENSAGVMVLDGKFLWLGGSTSGNLRAICFNNVQIPATASILDAYIEFYAYGESPAASTEIYSELANSTGYSTSAHSISSKKYSYSKVKWSESNLTAKELIRTPNLQSIIDESRIKGWASGQNLAFKFEGLNTNEGINVYAYDGGASYRPKLVIKYKNEGGPNPLPIPVTIESVVSAANDDGSENSAGAMTLDGKFLWLGGSTSGHLRCIRFNNIVIPSNATIQNAYIEFYGYGSSEDATTYVYSEIGNPVIYTTAAKNMSSRNYSEKRVKWEAPVLVEKQKIKTPTLKSIIDENRSKGWQSGQSMAFRFEGLSANQGTTVYAYEGSTAYRPRLVIEYIQNEDQLVVEGAETDPLKMDSLRINEICSQGSKEQKEDWVELYNGHEFPLHIKGGVYLSDKNKNRTLFELKNIIIPAKGFYVFIADEQPENGKNYLPFDLKNSGETVYLSRSQTDLMDQVTFGTVPYNQSYGRSTDGTGEFVLFMTPTYGSSNKSGIQKADISFSHERGIYPSGFNLTITAPQNMTIRYTTDGKYPSQTSGTIYTGAINISKSGVVKAVAYNSSYISEVVAHTYVLQNNYANEKVESVSSNGTTKQIWTNKGKINSTEYGQALKSLPIVSMSCGSELADVYKEASLEFIDSHLYNESNNFFSNSMSRKSGNSTIKDYNSGYKFKFTREANARKSSYPFFDPYENDAFPMPEKIHTLELKEGQDGASSTWAQAGYARFSEKITMNLQKEMGKFALETRFVHFFYNGKYKGVKTLRTDFKQQNMEEIFGDDSDNYTKISLKVPGKNDMVTGVVESGDGLAAIWEEMKSYAAAKNLQGLKKLVDLEDLIKFQIMFMFIDCEPEVEIILHNNAGLDSKFAKAKFNINDTDGAYFANGSTNTSQIPSLISYGAATVTYRWTASDAKYRNGVGGFMEQFGGISTKGQAGNLEFKTLVKDYVLDAFGPVSGVGAGDAKYPISIQNVQEKIRAAQAELDLAYKLDAAWYSPNSTRYNDWKNACTRIIAQVPARVNLSLSKWNEFGLAHNLQAVTINAGTTIGANDAITFNNPNTATNVQIYYTTDGSDPMGNDGVISSSAKLYSAATGFKLSVGEYKLVVRPFITNNWGPKTKQDISVVSGFSLRNLSDDNNEASLVNVYPNPVKDILYISTPYLENNPMTATIYTIAGIEVLQKELVSNINSVNVSDLSNGIYVIQIMDKNNKTIQTFQIIKQ